MDELLYEEYYDDLKGRAEKGAEFLDTKIPNWEDRVNLDTLNMEYGSTMTDCQCVVVQTVRKDFFTAIQKDFGFTVLYGNETIDKGFALAHHENDEELYPILTEAWKEVINERRQRIASSPA